MTDPRTPLHLSGQELHALAAALPLCKHQKSRAGKRKVSWPVRTLAEAMAWLTIPPARVYRCGSHWHLAAVPLDTHGPATRTREWEDLMEDARHRAGRYGRQRVYGARTVKGKWIYRTHPAVFAHTESREYR